MYVIFLAGGIASGKSTVARELERLGARRIDLDALSRQVLEPGRPCTLAVAKAFGPDLLDPHTGQLDRALLARRAFSSPEGSALLETIELPFIRDALARELDLLQVEGGDLVCVVEVPLLDRMGEMLARADEVACVACPVEVRRARAMARGLDAEDADRRIANQPTDAWLAAHADTVIPNDGTYDDLVARTREFWEQRRANGWAHVRG